MTDQIQTMLVRLESLIVKAQTLVDSLDASCAQVAAVQAARGIDATVKAIFMQMGIDGCRSRLLKLDQPLVEQLIGRLIHPASSGYDVFRWLCQQLPEYKVSHHSIYRLRRFVRQAYNRLSLTHASDDGSSRDHVEAAQSVDQSRSLRVF